MPIINQMNAFRGVRSSNRDDISPKTLHESNSLYSKYWVQGFFSIVGKRNENTGEYSWPIQLTDPFVNILAIRHLYEKRDYYIGGEQDHIGLLDLVNPLYWGIFGSLELNIWLFREMSSDENSWISRIFSGIVGVILAPITAGLVISTLLTMHLWLLAKVIVAAISVTISSIFWYPIALLALKHSLNNNSNSDESSDDASNDAQRDVYAGSHNLYLNNGSVNFGDGDHVILDEGEGNIYAGDGDVNIGRVNSDGFINHRASHGGARVVNAGSHNFYGNRGDVNIGNVDNSSTGCCIL